MIMKLISCSLDLLPLKNVNSLILVPNARKESGNQPDFEMRANVGSGDKPFWVKVGSAWEKEVADKPSSPRLIK